MHDHSRAPQDPLSPLLTYLKQDCSNLALRLDAIRQACDIDQWETARALIDQGFTIHPAQRELLALSGVAYLHAQQYVEAEQALSAALAQGLPAPGPRYNLALSVFMQARYGDALELLTSPELTRAVPQSLLLRARCSHHLQRPDDAISDCRAHLAVAPDDADTHGLLSLLLQENQLPREAEAHIDAALKKNPRQIDAMLARACLQHEARHLAAAKASFENLLMAHPECGRGWHGLAMVEMVNFNFHKAKRHIERAAEHMPRHIGTWHILAWIHILQNEVAAAEKALQQAMAIDRNFGETHGGLAVIAALRGQEDEARAGMRRAVRLDPHCLSVEYAEMVLLQRQGRSDEMRAAFERFMRRPGPTGGSSIRQMVVAHLQQIASRKGPTAAHSTIH